MYSEVTHRKRPGFDTRIDLAEGFGAPGGAEEGVGVVRSPTDKPDDTAVGEGDLHSRVRGVSASLSDRLTVQPNRLLCSCAPVLLCSSTLVLFCSYALVPVAFFTVPWCPLPAVSLAAYRLPFPLPVAYCLMPAV